MSYEVCGWFKQVPEYAAVRRCGTSTLAGLSEVVVAILKSGVPQYFIRLSSNWSDVPLEVHRLGTGSIFIALYNGLVVAIDTDHLGSVQELTSCQVDGAWLDERSYCFVDHDKFFVIFEDGKESRLEHGLDDVQSLKVRGAEMQIVGSLNGADSSVDIRIDRQTVLLAGGSN